MTMIAGAPAFLRRARGFVPEPIELGDDGPATLALGAHLKTTVTVTRGREAFVSTHIGGLTDRATIAFHEETALRMLDILDVRPDIVACDLHPDLITTRMAEARGLPVYRAQHHAAHVAAIAAEHKIDGPLLGAALDGHGYGDDGGAWGGELMLIDKGSSGAASGIWRRCPCRAATAPRARPGAWASPFSRGFHAGREAPSRFPRYSIAADVARLAAAPGAARTTSLGRMFDAAAAILGVRLEQEYEGQAAMELEALCETPRALAGGFSIANDVLDLAPLFRALLDAGLSAREGAELFHGTLIEALAAWIGGAARRLGQTRVALGGGCLMNAALAEGRLAAAARTGDRTPSCAKNSMQRRRPVARTGVSRARGERVSLVEAKRCVLRYPPA